MEEWTGIADADRHLGRPTPLPTAALPLVRWVEVRPIAAGAVEVEWNLDDTRPGARGRLALYAGHELPPDRAWEVEAAVVDIGDARGEHRVLELAEAEASLRPAHELRWQAGGLHLRLTAQGPWDVEELLRIGASVRA